MSRLGPRTQDPAMLLRLPPNCQVIFDPHVQEYILYELQRYPTSEEGGKYVGYLDVTNQAHSKDRFYRVIITDFLPGGPNAKRTAVEFMPDGEFQERLFRQIEKRDRNIEHLGTWHSHHCNGLDHLSGGDIEGYLKTVNKAAYRPDVFVASLVKHLPKNSRDANWIDHFLFIRNHDCFYKITHHTTTMDSPTTFGEITGHMLQNDPVESAPIHDVRASAAPWYETQAGRKALAEDKKLFTERFGSNPRATRRDGVISMTCGDGSKFMTVSYPASLNDREITINIGSGSRTLFRIACDYSDRTIAYLASLATFEHF